MERDGARGVRPVPRRRNATLAAAAAVRRSPSRSASCSAESSCCPRPTPPRTRCGWGLTREFALTYSLHPSNLLQLWSPYFFERGALQRRRLHVVSRVRHLLGRHPAGRAHLGVDPPSRAARATGAHRGGHGVRGRDAWSSRSGAMAASRCCSRICRCSSRSARRFATSSSMQFALAILAAVTIDDLLAIAETGEHAAPAGPMAGLVDSGRARDRHDARSERSTPAVRHAHVRERGSRGPGRRDRGGGHAAGVPRRAPRALGARRAGRRHGGGSGRVGHPVHLPRTGADDRGADAGRACAGPAMPAGFVRGRAGARAVPSRSPRDAGIPAHDRLRRALPGNPASARQRASPCGCRGRDGSSRRTASDIRSKAAWRACGSSTSRGRTSTGSARLAVDRPGRLVAQVDARAGASSRSPNGSTTAGRRRSTAPRCRWCGWKETFSAAWWRAASTTWTSGSWPRSFVYGSIVSAIGAALLAGVLIARLR